MMASMATEHMDDHLVRSFPRMLNLRIDMKELTVEVEILPTIDAIIVVEHVFEVAIWILDRPNLILVVHKVTAT